MTRTRALCTSPIATPQHHTSAGHESAGSGFADGAGAHVVAIAVPTSSNYPNAAILCDVLTASASSITCRTRSHLPSNAGDALPPTLTPSPAAAITLAHCGDAPDSDTGKMACWARAVAQRRHATCAGDCTFAYSAEATPRLTGFDPGSAGESGVVKGGDALVIHGTGVLASCLLDLEAAKANVMPAYCMQLPVSSRWGRAECARCNHPPLARAAAAQCMLLMLLHRLPAATHHLPIDNSSTCRSARGHRAAPEPQRSCNRVLRWLC